MGLEYSIVLRSSKHDADVLDRPLPGRAFAEEILEALKSDGLEVSGVFDEEPFWEIRILLNGKSIGANLVLFEPNEDRAKAIWWISLVAKGGLLSRMLGRDNLEETRQFARRLHRAIGKLTHVEMERWFRGGSFDHRKDYGVSNPADLGGDA